jgi:hypothetical protein
VSLLHTTLLVVAIVPCVAAWRHVSKEWHSMAHHVTCRRLQPDGSAAPPAATTNAADASQLTDAARRTLDTQEQLQVCRDVCRAIGYSTYEAGRNSTCLPLQDMITDELVGMAAGMKSNTLAMESQLRHRYDTVHDVKWLQRHCGCAVGNNNMPFVQGTPAGRHGCCIGAQPAAGTQEQAAGQGDP